MSQLTRILPLKKRKREHINLKEEARLYQKQENEKEYMISIVYIFKKRIDTGDMNVHTITVERPQ